jgi:putative acetyltransferase
MEIREMEPRDNKTMAEIIVNVLAEHGFKDEQTGGYELNNLPLKIKDLYSHFYHLGGKYFVIEDSDTGTILGGGGFLPLPSNLTNNFNGFFSKNFGKACSLEKLYFLPQLRGTGLASQLMNKIQEAAVSIGCQSMYIETEPNLERAHHFYQKMGFSPVEVEKKDTVAFFKILDCAYRNKIEPTKNHNPVCDSCLLH